MKPRLEVVNCTAWNTRHLRKLLVACVKEWGQPHRIYRVTIRYQRAGTRRVGRASIGGSSITLLVPRPGAPTCINAGVIAATMQHEMAHNHGLRHRDMEHGCHIGAAPAWASWHIITSRPEKPKKTREERTAALVEKREKLARDALARWQRRLKLAQTKVHAYKRKVRVYDARNAAARGGVDA
jgi:hypothetical protein